MRIIPKIFSLLILILLMHNAWGTAQVSDYLIYKGDTLKIYANPLESYFDSTLRPRPDSVFDKYGYKSTGCWRGYIGYWEIKNDSLFLLELHGDSCKIDLSLIFKDRQTDKKIFADWVNFSILNPYGDLVYYVHMGYESIYEYERKFIFSQGILTDIIQYDNSKSKRSKFTGDSDLLKNYIQDNIDYSNISNEPYEKAKVYVQIYSVTGEGKIDSVKVMRGWDKERDNEAISVVKSIPEWDIIFSQGQQIQIPWIIPVIFGKGD